MVGPPGGMRPLRNGVPRVRCPSRLRRRGSRTNVSAFALSGISIFRFKAERCVRVRRAAIAWRSVFGVIAGTAENLACGGAGEFAVVVGDLAVDDGEVDAGGELGRVGVG